jgi:DNA end-binding protein Ku
MARSIWNGVISFGMVSIPVRLSPATQDRDVSFHLLHEPDHSRIQFKRWCAEEDKEVNQDELVRAFEVSKSHYVEVTEEDLENLPLPSRHTIELSAFVRSDEVDPIYFEKSYYLEPEETGRKAYALLIKILEQKGVTGLASVALRNKESLCALRPRDGVLLLETLHYPDEIRKRDWDLPHVAVSERELDVAGSLVDALAEPFEPSKYHDHYREALLEMIENKTAGREVVAPEGAPAAKVTDLMSALRASLEAAREGRGGGRPAAGRARGGHKERPAAARGRPKATRKKPAHKAA